jgi:hypothetical protein
MAYYRRPPFVKESYMRIFLCLLYIVFTVQAAPIFADSTAKNSISHGLPPEKLEAIQLIGRYVLQAKNTAQDDTVNKEQFLLLKATVDKLIAVEIQPAQAGKIHLNNNASSPSVAQPNTNDAEKTSARTHAWDVVTRLRQDAGHLQRQGKHAPKQEVYSAGFPVGEQHGRLFDHWADTLGATLDNNNPNRISQLIALQNQLKIGNPDIVAVPITRQTPTIQAMPWKEPSEAANKTLSKNKLKK